MTVYREEMDEEYGNKEEASKVWRIRYMQVSCNWSRAIQRFVSACMVVGGCPKSHGGVNALVSTDREGEMTRNI
jgi:hypothetical protein